MASRAKLFLILLLSQLSFSQDDQAVVSLPEFNILYRGYKNKIEVGTNNGNSTYRIEAEGLRLERDSVHHYENSNGEIIDTVLNTYIAKPFSSNVARIIFIDTLTNDTLGIHKFRVQNLPPPQVYLGTIPSGSIVSAAALRSMTKLFAKYPPEIPLNATFAVSTWELSSTGTPDISVQGTSARLSDDALKLLRSMNKGDKLVITAKYKGMGYTGNMSSIIEVK